MRNLPLISSAEQRAKSLRHPRAKTFVARRCRSLRITRRAAPSRDYMWDTDASSRRGLRERRWSVCVKSIGVRIIANESGDCGKRAAAVFVLLSERKFGPRKVVSLMWIYLARVRDPRLLVRSFVSVASFWLIVLNGAMEMEREMWVRFVVI